MVTQEFHWNNLPSVVCLPLVKSSSSCFEMRFIHSQD
jgi:hypothetical protein